MGFLDFLKKDKPQPAPLFTQDNVPPPPSPQSDLLPLPPMPDLPHDPAQIDWSSPPELEPLPKTPVPTGSMMAGQMQNPEPMLQGDENDHDKAPIPPANKEAPDFLDKAVNEFEPKPVAQPASQPAPQLVPPAAPPSAPQPAQSPPDQAASAVELPDFTEEDLAALENATLPALPPLPSVKMVTEESVIPLPANAIALPDDDIKLPTGEVIEQERIEAAKFVSSSTYFTIIADIKSTRKSLRQSDDTIKEAILRHEQLDLQYKRVATDMNAVQEHLIRIDGALFE